MGENKGGSALQLGRWTVQPYIFHSPSKDSFSLDEPLSAWGHKIFVGIRLEVISGKNGFIFIF